MLVYWKLKKMVYCVYKTREERHTKNPDFLNPDFFLQKMIIFVADINF